MLFLCLFVHECPDLLACGHWWNPHRIRALADRPDQCYKTCNLQRVCEKNYHNRIVPVLYLTQGCKYDVLLSDIRDRQIGGHEPFCLFCIFVKAFTIHELGPITFGDMLHECAVGLRIFTAMLSFHKECRHEFNTSSSECIVVSISKTKPGPGSRAAITLPVEYGGFSLHCYLRKERHNAGLGVRFYLQCSLGFCITPENGHGFMVKPEFVCGNTLHMVPPSGIIDYTTITDDPPTYK